MSGKIPSKSSVIFWVAGVFTFGWLVVAFLLGWFAHPGAGGRTYGALAANEWGDFLAGVFAPVAFFWLFAAVWLQSKELGAQRNELELTRKEMEENRKVTTAQAKYIGTQTAILQDEETRRKWEDVDNLFRAEVNKLVSLIWLHESPFNFTHNGAHVINVSSPDAVEDFEFIARVASQLTSQYAGNGVANITTPLTWNNRERFEKVVAAVKECQARVKEASPAMQARATALRLAEIMEHAELLSERASPPKDVKG